MKKLLLAALALAMLSTVSTANAQKGAIRLGGGLWHSPGSNAPGGGAAADIGLGDKPFALSITAEYYTKSGGKFIPITAVALYRKSMPNGKVGVFFGGGGGYSIFDKGTANSNKPVVTGIGGVMLNVAPKIGVYGKFQYYRQIVSGALNTYAFGGGIAINLMPAE